MWREACINQFHHDCPPSGCLVDLKTTCTSGATWRYCDHWCIVSLRCNHQICYSYEIINICRWHRWKDTCPLIKFCVFVNNISDDLTVCQSITATNDVMDMVIFLLSQEWICMDGYTSIGKWAEKNVIRNIWIGLGNSGCSEIPDGIRTGSELKKSFSEHPLDSFWKPVVIGSDYPIP